MPSHYVLCLAQPEVNQTSEYCSQLCRSNEANMYSVCLWYHVYLQSSGLWATRIKLFSLTHLMGQMLALQPNRWFPWRICFQYLMMKNCLQRINKCTCVWAPARPKPSISAGTANDQCSRKSGSDGLEGTQAFIFKCHFNFLLPRPASRHCNWERWFCILLFISPQCSLHYTDKKTLLWTVYSKCASATHSAVLEVKPGRKRVTPIEQSYFFQTLCRFHCRFIACWSCLKEEIISRATKSVLQFLPMFFNSHSWSAFCLDHMVALPVSSCWMPFHFSLTFPFSWHVFYLIFFISPAKPSSPSLAFSSPLQLPPSQPQSIPQRG